jgi:hypothetical protein
MPDSSLPLLNVYEIDLEGVQAHVVCFVDPVLAGARGIDTASIIGRFQPGPEGDFQAETFELNPAFIARFVDYMNDVAGKTPQIMSEAAKQPGEWLYIVDPRFRGGDADEPPIGDIVGCFAVDEAGQIAPGSFQYNKNHDLFDPERGVSGLFSDRPFYDWLHGH